MSEHDDEQPKDRARRRLLRMGAYAPAALVSLAAVSRSAERAAPTTSVGTVVTIKADVTVKPTTQVQAQAQPKVKGG